MSSAKPHAPRKSIFNGHLLKLNNKRLKFFLDGYNSCEFHALTKIIEAYGGQLTVPDKDTIIFAERDRPVQKYYYRYDIKFIHDCVVTNRMQNINNYLLPATSGRHIKSEPLCSEPANDRQKNPKLNPRGIDSSRRAQENFPTKDIKVLQNNSTLISSSNEGSHKRFAKIQKETNALPAKSSIADMPNLIPSISNSSVSSMTSKSPEDVIICISDDSDSEPPKLVKSAAIDLNQRTNDDVKRPKIDGSKCPDVSKTSNPPSISATFGSDQVRDSSFSSRYPSSSAVHLNDSCSPLMNKSLVRMVARKSTTKNGGNVVRREGEDRK